MKLHVVAFLLLFTTGLMGCMQANYSESALNETTSDTLAVADSSGSISVAEAGPEASADATLVERKIVYKADVDLVVEEFDMVPSRVKTLVEQHGGYIAKSNIRGRPGSPRSGEWTIRVPVANYEGFLSAARELGETRSVRTDSDDVTAEFYDVEARIRNMQQEEERLRKHLDESTGKLDDILQVEREISRVRGEIERMEGRMRVLKDLTSLTTINLRVDEIKDYVPEGEATYSTQVRRAFSGSIAALVAAAKGVSLAMVVAVPWLGVLAVLIVMLVLIRKLFRRTR